MRREEVRGDDDDVHGQALPAGVWSGVRRYCCIVFDEGGILIGSLASSHGICIVKSRCTFTMDRARTLSPFFFGGGVESRHILTQTTGRLSLVS